MMLLHNWNNYQYDNFHDIFLIIFWITFQITFLIRFFVIYLIALHCIVNYAIHDIFIIYSSNNITTGTIKIQQL